MQPSTQLISSGQDDRLLRAVPLTRDGLGLDLTRDVLGQHDAMAEVIGVEHLRRQAVATPVSGAAIGVDGNPGHVEGTGKTSGSASTDLSAAVKVSCVPGLIS